MKNVTGRSGVNMFSVRWKNIIKKLVIFGKCWMIDEQYKQFVRGEFIKQVKTRGRIIKMGCFNYHHKRVFNLPQISICFSTQTEISETVNKLRGKKGWKRVAIIKSLPTLDHSNRTRALTNPYFPLPPQNRLPPFLLIFTHPSPSPLFHLFSRVSLRHCWWVALVFLIPEYPLPVFCKFFHF